MATEIVIQKGKKISKNPIVIEGFPSKGFVSTIATRYMIDELDMDLIGCIESDKISSVAVIHDAKPMRPIRIYSKDNILVIFSELIIPVQYIPEFSNALTNWFKEINPSKVVLLAGISGRLTEKEHDIIGIANTPELNKRLKELDVTKIEEGMLTGISSDLLLYCVETSIPTISLMAETRHVPDPLASASLLKVLDKLLDLGIDTKKLVEEGKKIEEMFKEITEQLKRGKDGHREMMEAYPSMYG